MARKLRIEYPGAVYHIINRGNARANIFANPEAKKVFLGALSEVCERTGWRVHAWCLLNNQYHLAVSTPEANLVAGMQWLQTTFSARFNRLRNKQGPVFQGRYKALCIESGQALGAVCHYIHLNPLRAGLVDREALAGWSWCSLRWILQPKERADWFDPAPAFKHPCKLKDTPAGGRNYRDYLLSLASDKAEQQKQGFEQFSSGWAIGSAGFKEGLLEDAGDLKATGLVNVTEARALAWGRLLEKLKKKLGAHARTDQAKSADWKVAIAAEMKRCTTVTNQWLSDQLYMGNMYTVSRLIKECRAGKRASEHHKILTAKSRV